MNIKDLDLNLLRLFEATYRHRNVSRAADSLDISQPAASQGLARLRILLGDPLFVRASGGVRPTPRADRLAEAVQSALATLEHALTETTIFDPLASRRVFRIHMTDIGEGRFLPAILSALHERAPGVRVETLPVPTGEISEALNTARIDFAFGFLPGTRDTKRDKLFDDRYVILMRSGHPFLKGRGKTQPTLDELESLEFVGVRSHKETLRILQLLNLEENLRITTQHFMVLPDIVRATDLCVVMPGNIARGFGAEGEYAIIEPAFPSRDFVVALHWSKRFEADPALRWFRRLTIELFAEKRS